jgi:hypothetical protein
MTANAAVAGDTAGIINLTDNPDAARGITLFKGGRLFVVKTHVDPAWEWSAMLRQAYPNYQSSDVQRVSGLYPLEPGEPKDYYVFGLNFGTSILDTKPAIDWGKQNGLPEATPRQVFAVARDVPDLNRKLNMPWMGLISPKFCTFYDARRVCHACFDGAGRDALLDWFGHGWVNSIWFAFFRECPGA